MRDPVYYDVDYETSAMIRGGIICALRNCCLETSRYFVTQPVLGASMKSVININQNLEKF